MGAPHRIRRLRCRAVVSAGGDAFALRAELRRSLDDGVIRTVEAAFDAAEIGEDVLEIDRLELHIRLAEPDLAAQLPGLVAEQVRDRLRSLTGGWPGPVVAIRNSPARHAEDTLTAYLGSGTLPALHGGRDTAEAVQLLRGAVRQWLPRGIAEWHRAGAPAAVLRRLLQLAPDRDWRDIALALAPLVPAADSSDLVEAVTEIARLAASRHDRLELAIGVIMLARGDAGEAAKPRIASLLAAGRSAPLTSKEQRGPLAALERIVSRRERSPRDVAPSAPTDTGPTLRVVVTRRDASSALPRRAAAEDPLPALVSSAGLVLLHPFLVRLFRAIGIVAGDAAEVPAAELPRAAAALHWLATRSDEPPEFELPLVKLLLGLDPGTPLIVGGGLLSESDRAEAAALLSAVIEHWTALGRTSVEGLRGSFLRRTGLLRDGDDGWHLQVLPEGFDVLLDRLPWGIGVIRLPWMPRPIFVEWSTR